MARIEKRSSDGAKLRRAFAMAITHDQAGRLSEAFALYRQVVEWAPDHAQAWHRLALLAHRAGHAALARSAVDQALACDACEPEFHNTRATLELVAGRYLEAVAGYRRAVALKPDYAEALCNLGNALREVGAYSEAVAQLEAALALRPDLAPAWNNLGTVWPELNRLDQAVVCFERAIALHSGYAEAFNNLGVVLKDQGRTEEAIGRFRQALALWPGYAAAHSNLLFALCFRENADSAAVFREHLAFDRVQVRPLAPPFTGHVNRRDPERRLRIGYLSPDFRRHPAGHFLLPVIEHHDHRAFEVFCYSSNVRSDDLTQRFCDCADHWCVCHAFSDAALAERIQADGIDILVECAGHLLGSRLVMCGRRPAPIQVSYPMYPNTTGVSTIDYRIVDHHIAPPWADEVHSERLVRLPDAHLTYRPSRDDIQPVAVSPHTLNGFITFGSFNNFAKVGAATVAAWARILAAVPGSRLMLKWSGLAEGSDRCCADRFAACGIGRERLILADPSPDPYTPYRLLDIALDPIGANGGTTTCDALWMGVPVVTHVGQTPGFARQGLCYLTTVGLPELVAETVDKYVDRAVRLATDSVALASVRQGLRERFAASPLMDAAGYTRQLEWAYRTMWRRWCADVPPAAFSVSRLLEPPAS